MEAVHNNELTPLLPSKVTSHYDYLHSVMFDENGVEHKLTLPSSDVMKYVMSDGNSFIIRPSGTEPKIKVYFTMKGTSVQDALNHGKDYENAINTFIDKVAGK
jgi:phosphoglucomutase